MTRTTAPPLPRWLWLWFPLALYFGHFAVIAISEPFYDEFMRGELGFTEEATFVLVAMAFVVGLLALKQFKVIGDWRGQLLLIIFCLGCFYFAGEEASWGQHWFDWHTSSEWASLNDHHETNLHNLTGVAGLVFNKLPKFFLTLAIFVGGAILPRVRRHHPYPPQSLASQVMPGTVCIPVSLVATLGDLPYRFTKAVTGEAVWFLDTPAREVKELLIGAFLFIYAAALWQRLKQARASACA